MPAPPAGNSTGGQRMRSKSGWGLAVALVALPVALVIGMAGIVEAARFGFGSAGNATEATIFTAIGHQTIESIVVTNTSTAERAVRLHNVPSGGTAAATNAIFMYDWVIEAGNSITINTEFAMLPGDFLQARADGTGVTVAVSGRFSG